MSADSSSNLQLKVSSYHFWVLAHFQRVLPAMSSDLLQQILSSRFISPCKVVKFVDAAAIDWTAELAWRISLNWSIWFFNNSCTVWIDTHSCWFCFWGEACDSMLSQMAAKVESSKLGTLEEEQGWVINCCCCWEVSFNFILSQLAAKKSPENEGHLKTSQAKSSALESIVFHHQQPMILAAVFSLWHHWVCVELEFHLIHVLALNNSVHPWEGWIDESW